MLGSIKVINDTSDHDKIYPILRLPVNFKWFGGELFKINSYPPNLNIKKNNSTKNPKYIKIN